MLNDLLLWVLDLVESLDPVVRVVATGIAMMLETSALVGVLIPGDAVVLLTAAGVSSLTDGAILVAAVVTGALIGESIGYLLGRWFGPSLQRSRLGRLIGAAQWDRAQRYVQRRGGMAIFLSRFLPVLHSTVPLIAGMSRFSYRRFLAWTAPACVLWATAYVTVGSLAATIFRDLAPTLQYAGYLAVGAVVVAGAIALGVRRLLARAESRHYEPVDAPSRLG